MYDMECHEVLSVLKFHNNNIVNDINGVTSVVDTKGRTHGLLYFIDITVTVDPSLNVKQSHDITVNIEKALSKEFY